jgi:DNA-binding beta-propeller fold protein YncE
MSGIEEEGPVRAPELAGAVAWLNVDAPLTLKALRGKVVLLDFWTYGCINCVHVLPDLKRLEAKYANELVVIGVHSAKFPNEKVTENLRRVVQRYDIHHPVANDADMSVWRAYTVRAWPTQVLIDPAGYIVGAASGEGHGEQFDRAIAAVIQVFDERGELDRRPLDQFLQHQSQKAAASAATGPLMFPGKVLADEPGGRLFIADSNHHRVLICALPDAPHPSPLPASGAREQSTGLGDSMRVLDVVGAGEPGSDTGAFDRATFRAPQGLALSGDGATLYVADTGNHLIRAIDLSARTVKTAAGTGQQARGPNDGGAAASTPLSSPWDLVMHGPLLFIAMAGTHQIWMLDATRGLIWPYAGSGREARADGSVDDAAFAQPSGLTIADGTMFVADSESNIIRAIELPPVNRVTTLAGGDLFDFGDKDGTGDAARFQHPLGIAHHAGQIYIADTYNHRIKRLDPRTRLVSTFAGTGRPGHQDGPAATAQFYEPAGLTVAGDHLYVADTNNHAIRAIDLRTNQVGTLTLT